MFKRLLAWLFPAPSELDLTDARWVVSGSNQVLVKPVATKVKIAPTVHTGDLPGGEDRPFYVHVHGPLPEAHKASGRAWLISKLPDECVFM